MITAGFQIRAARAGLGWSQTELAERAGIHAQSAPYWERQGAIPFPAPRDGREKKSPTKGVLDYWNAAMADCEGPGDEAG